MLEIGSVFAGRYEVLTKLGEGGAGLVFKVRDVELNTLCAVKLLGRDTVGDAEWRKRFLREGKAMSRIDHPNVAKVFRLGFDAAPFLVMEFIDGESLRNRLMRSEALPTVEALRIIEQAGSGMSAAHKCQVLHRDLKPDNIMLVASSVDGSSFVKVVDFGLARLNPPPGRTASQHLTQTGALLGSVHYMSPEQCQGRPGDERSDIYALGCVLFECIAGYPPFTADTAIGVLHKHQTEDNSLLADSNDRTFQPEIKAILRKALSKNQADRYQSMDELREDIVLCINGDTPRHAELRGRNPLAARSTRTALWLCLSVLFLCAMVAVVYITTLRHASSKEQSKWTRSTMASANIASTESKLGLALREAENLIAQQKPAAALALLDEALPQSQGVPTRGNLTTGQILVCRAKAFSMMGNKDQVRINAEGAITLLARLEDRQTETWENEAIHILLANNCPYQFDNELLTNQVYPKVQESGEVNVRRILISNYKTALLRIQKDCLDGTVRCDLHRNLLKLQESLARQSKSASDRANYWHRVADAAEPYTKDQESSAQNAIEAYRSAGDTLGEIEMILFLADHTTDRTIGNQRVAKVDALAKKVKSSVENADQLIRIKAHIARHWMRLGETERARNLCLTAIETCPANVPSVSSLLEVYTDSVQQTKQSSEAALSFLRNKIATLKKAEELPLKIQFQRASARLLFDLRRVREAEKAFALILSEESLYSDLGSDEMKDTCSYMDCCSFLNMKNAFDRANVHFAIEHYHSRPSREMKLRLLDEKLRRGEFEEVEEALTSPGNIVSLEKPDVIMDLEKEGDVVASVSWHSACFGSPELSKKLRQFHSHRAGSERNEDWLLELMLGNAEQSTMKLESHLNQNTARIDRDSTLKLLTLACLLNGKLVAARRHFSELEDQYVKSDSPLTTDILLRFLSSAEGRPSEALEPLSDRGIPTVANSPVYQKLFMAKIAKANGHRMDESIYLRSARQDLLQLLSPDHQAVQALERKLKEVSKD